jgi:hypothetical protein
MALWPVLCLIGLHKESVHTFAFTKKTVQKSLGGFLSVPLLRVVVILLLWSNNVVGSNPRRDVGLGLYEYIDIFVSKL